MFSTHVCAEKRMSVKQKYKNFKMRWDEHNVVNKNSEPAKHLARSVGDMYLPNHLKIPSKEKFWKHTL